MIYVHLSIIAAAGYFSVCKLIGWDAANIYLFKFNGRTLEKIVSKVNNQKSRKSNKFHFFSVSIVDFK